METWPKAINLRNVSEPDFAPEVVHHEPAPIPTEIPVEVPMAIEQPPAPPEPAPIAASEPNTFA
ncbi:MAG: hypothetical protein EBU90_19180 [Proteobacteria bacterium]|nr:hypothetical protein [Pseudomonadota bacterium]NBP14457.1 hypothetical protein [bacterium]